MDLAEVKEYRQSMGGIHGIHGDWLIAEVEALTTENTRIFGMIDAREQTIAELTALCDGYRGEIQRLKVACECHRIQAVDRGNSYQKAASEVERLQAIVTALEEGCYSCQHPKRVGELTCQKNALQQVVAERDTEIERLKDLIGRTVETMNDNMKAATKEQMRLESALTRARAEGMELAAEIVDAECERILATQTGKQDDFNRSVDQQVRMVAVMLPEVAEAIRARAARGEQ